MVRYEWMCMLFCFDSCTVRPWFWFWFLPVFITTFPFLSHVVLAVVGVCLELMAYADETNISMIFMSSLSGRVYRSPVCLDSRATRL